MIADRIENMLNTINQKTISFQLQWRPINEYIEYCHDNSDMSEKIMMMEANEYVDFHKDQSFFVRKDSAYLFLLSYNLVSAKDGTESECCELYASLYPNSEVVIIPSYIDGGIQTIRDSVIDYWETENCNCVAEVSAIIGVLGRFAD